MRAAAVLWVLVGTACALPEVRSHVRGRDGNPAALQTKKVVRKYRVARGNPLFSSFVTTVSNAGVVGTRSENSAQKSTSFDDAAAKGTEDRALGENSMGFMGEGRRLTDAWQDQKIESYVPFSVVSGNSLAVADLIDADADDAKSKINIYRFDYTQQQWVDEKTPKILTDSWCGMALSGETLAVGDCDEDVKGTVSIYLLPDWQLVKQFSILPSTMGIARRYESSSPVALHDNVLAVCGDDGNLYASRYDKSAWLELEIISEFACLSPVVSGNAIAVTDGDYTVKVYRYADHGGWKEEAEITVPRAGPAGPQKTHPLAIAMSGPGDLLAVGASGTNTEIRKKDFEDAAGMTYIYQYSGNTSTWLKLGSPLQASDATPKDSFGYAVSFSGKHLAVGAPQFRFPEKGEEGRPGKVYIFYPGGGGTSWTQGRVLQPEDGTRNDFFGKFISSTDRYIAIGAWCSFGILCTWPTYIYNLPCPPGRTGDDCELDRRCARRHVAKVEE